MLFLHGYGANKECFTRQINYFSRFYRITALDFPAFGASGQLPSAWSVGDYAHFLREKIADWGLIRPCVVAHSFGARIAVKMAGSSDCFEKMALTGAAGIVRHGAVYHAKVFAYRAIKKVFPRYADRKFGSAEYRALSPLMRESYKKIVGEDLRTVAEKIRCPVLLVYGTRDRTTPLREGKIYQRHIPCAVLRKMRGAGHFPFLDDPQTFNEIIEEFLENGEKECSKF